jgi:D-3-phosphoglycerate dehydrogenase
MKIAITDYSFPDLAVEEAILVPQGHQIVAWKERRTPGELTQLVTDADAVITQFASVNAEVIESMSRAKVIARYGIGVDNVDLAAAKTQGIPVCNVPDYCIDEVADQTLGFILSLTRQVVPNCLKVRSGSWGLASSLDQMRTLKDLTVGVVGFGRIGREVALRLKPFKCRILVHDPVVPVTEIERAGCTPVPLTEIFARADLITLHCPSTAQTRGMLNRETIAQTKPGVIFVNVARGDLIDPAALTDALTTGHVAAAALDVFSPEPIPGDHPILKLENVVLASHIASCSVPAVHKLRETAANLALLAVSGKPLPNVVNGVTASPGS